MIEKIENKIIELFGLSFLFGIIGMIGFGIGFIIVFNGYGYSDIIEVSTVSIVKIEDDIIVFSPEIEMYHGEYKINEIKKPKFIPLKEQDTIQVRYHIDNPSDVHYVLNPEIGIIIIMGGFLPLSLIIIPIPILFLYSFLVNTIKKIKDKKE